ncbi:MAG: Coenzyme F420 hydrogenase/dehydrogenase, beta subunit C-terminal domain [Dehalococcoidia bacterium]|nr:Coenzyme F420 hydrogenase/dehydrogenase, beta subunit C-terminal domain [Dehalococcoidia bacterium]MDD5495459.1 Coenzyme F420 hydrogenase/dehydrogenase, beta subunit C-terminal domain [Dehalococcoidia bacterium]
MVAKTKGIKELFDEVINTGLCAACGACVGDCPYMVYYKGKVRMLDLCGRDEGHCYEYCPRTRTDLDAISHNLFGVACDGSEIGPVRDIFMARSADPKILKKAQYGGTVTALLSLALEEKQIGKAILCKTDKGRLPAGYVASTAKEVLQCAGSNYIAYPALEALNRMPRDSKDRLGIVLTPCQSIALAKMRLSPASQRASIDNVSLVVGLFCTWALAYDGFTGFLKDNVDLTKVKKFDIPPPPANRFDVYDGKKVKSFPLDEVRKYRMPTCACCLDMTSEFSDISVGAVEGTEGWNTVIVRSDRGTRIIGLAVKKGVLEVQALPPQNLAHLKEASLLKKNRGLKEIVNRTGNRNDLLYLKMADEVRDRLLGGG